jgi:hypothetical protein
MNEPHIDSRPSFDGSVSLPVTLATTAIEIVAPTAPGPSDTCLGSEIVADTACAASTPAARTSMSSPASA